eukprot:scaffold1682_cov271-Prasinococcus_capsulatus_cf.AAC.3
MSLLTWPAACHCHYMASPGPRPSRRARGAAPPERRPTVVLPCGSRARLPSSPSRAHLKREIVKYMIVMPHDAVVASQARTPNLVGILVAHRQLGCVTGPSLEAVGRGASSGRASTRRVVVAGAGSVDGDVFVE